MIMIDIHTFDRPLPGWFAIDVLRKESRKWDWCALMVDVPPDELKHCLCKIAWLYVHPNEYKPDGSRTAREAYVRIPGKHRNVTRHGTLFKT
jgi:hypothetical protein